MKKRIFLLGLLAMAIFLVGCTSELTILMKLPIEVETTYHKAIDGYLYYDFRNDEIIITSYPLTGRRYTEPLNLAQIRVLETGNVTFTDSRGYFVIRGIPGSYHTINLDIKHDDLRRPSSSRRYSVYL